MKLLIACLLVFVALFASSQKLVLPGDHPDPSVVKIGDTYWASATSSNWFPAYPLLESKDLINWKLSGHVFDKKPEWADYYFWAPEISYENGKVYIYYAAHKKNGNLCVGIASADKPEGPYTDHGALICEEAGSIDAFPIRDENGKLHLVWKEDGNSVRKPTPIWAIELNEARTAVVGEKKELFRNDAPWEANLVEGVSMIKHGDYYYAFYAAAGCCGTGCTYTTGIARSKSLMGPWEKYDKNPVLTNDENWKCPGHGTPVEKDGKFYFLYHAYNNKSTVFAGRQGLLIEFRFTPDGWIEFVKENQPVDVKLDMKDNFDSKTLSRRWEWSVFQDIKYEISRKKLELQALPTSTGAFAAQKSPAADYIAEIRVVRKRSDAMSGIGAIGDDKNSVSALIKKDSVYVIELRNDKENRLVKKAIVGRSKYAYLKMEVKNGKDISFYFSSNGRNYQLLNETPANGGFLPPWDRAVRVGLISKGRPADEGVFTNFSLKTQ